MTRLAGFHLHLYQPPREDPWLGLVSNEWSAWPYHDWNERITDECYRALVAVALSAGEDADVELVTPLPESVFDVGATLHRWWAREAPDVDRALDFEAAHAEGGAAGVAMAAPFVHAILPLASEVDRERLVAWGIADYRARFGCAPRGVWLPETAVDLASLDTLARQGATFTILMPSQALRVREVGGEWRTVSAESLDTSLVYRVALDEGRSIDVVFGHRDLSQRVAFGGLLSDGTSLADQMIEALGEDGVVLLVADGETYGHHHRFGDLGLAWALRRLRGHYGVATALGPWLDTHQATHEVELAAVSAWSCAHGVERWRSDCGCVTGGQPGWRQDWRAPLRRSLDWLRDSLGAVADERLAPLVHSVAATLHDYGEVLAGATSPGAFVAAHARQPLDDEDAVLVLEICEIHRHLLYSFTSCAWFFADPADIETSLSLRHAAVALERARRALEVDLEAAFLERLVEVRSNRPGLDGRVLWRRASDPYRFDEAQIAAGFAAEYLAHGDDARAERGHWLGDVVPLADGDDVAVTTRNARTGRRRSFVVGATRVGPVGLSLHVEGEESVDDFSLVDLGLDVVARVATAWLVAPGSTDFERALQMLAAGLLTRRASRDDVEVLVALAGAPRCVTPAGEATARRALLAAVAGCEDVADLELLAPLAAAVGLEGALARSGAPAGHG